MCGNLRWRSTFRASHHLLERPCREGPGVRSRGACEARAPVPGRHTLRSPRGDPFVAGDHRTGLSKAWRRGAPGIATAKTWETGVEFPTNCAEHSIMFGTAHQKKSVFRLRPAFAQAGSADIEGWAREPKSRWVILTPSAKVTARAGQPSAPPRHPSPPGKGGSNPGASVPKTVLLGTGHSQNSRVAGHCCSAVARSGPFAFRVAPKTRFPAERYAGSGRDPPAFARNLGWGKPRLNASKKNARRYSATGVDSRHDGRPSSRFVCFYDLKHPRSPGELG